MTWKSVAEFLQENGGKPYKSFKKCDGAERNQMMALHVNAIHTISEFESLAMEACAGIQGLCLVRMIRKNFLDGSMRHLRSYTWERFCVSDDINSPANISLFCEKFGDEMRFRVAIDIDLKSADPDQLEIYNKSLLRFERPEGMVYLANSYGNKDLTECNISGDELYSEIMSGKYRKAEIAYIIQASEPDNKITEEVNWALRKLKPIYEDILESMANE